MPEVSAKELTEIQASIAKIERNSQDVQRLFEFHKTDHEMLIQHHTRLDAIDKIITDLLNDKQGLFKWAMVLIANFIVSA